MDSDTEQHRNIDFWRYDCEKIASGLGLDLTFVYFPHLNGSDITVETRQVKGEPQSDVY